MPCVRVDRSLSMRPSARRKSNFVTITSVRVEFGGSTAVLSLPPSSGTPWTTSTSTSRGQIAMPPKDSMVDNFDMTIETICWQRGFAFQKPTRMTTHPLTSHTIETDLGAPVVQRSMQMQPFGHRIRPTAGTRPHFDSL